MRNKVYADSASEQNRADLRCRVKKELKSYGEEYRSIVSENKHRKNIIALANTISCKHKIYLRNGRLRIGTAQKALNLYLKYLWCLDKAVVPPHFPIDSIMIRKISQEFEEFKNIPWTKIDCIGLYDLLIEKSKVVSKKEILAVWELKEYQEERKKMQEAG